MKQSEETKNFQVPVIDLFAGPGGLSEGFSALRGRGGNRFKVALSIEKDPTAFETLQLRAFFRTFERGRVPKDYYSFLAGDISKEQLFESYPIEYARARAETWRAELGKIPTEELHSRIENSIGNHKWWALIGGPPCQAYSLAGRVRNQGNPDYVAEKDHRQYLYKEYLKILAEHWPPVFVMENVKGLLSAKINEEKVFSKILQDLQEPAAAVRFPGKTYKYRIYSLAKAGKLEKLEVNDFIVRSEEYGIPQARHRVFLLGIREDLDIAPGILQKAPGNISVSQVLKDLPSLRSALNTREDSPETWIEEVRKTPATLKISWNGRSQNEPTFRQIKKLLRKFKAPQNGIGKEFLAGEYKSDVYPEWYYDPELKGICNHTARSHMPSDIQRYFFASSFARAHGRSPMLKDFPKSLLPDHENVKKSAADAYFGDRFRVQPWKKPATTITSHISKDGHYFIHPDPKQARSFTVREAARIQTFPDNYFFCGGRTAQYAQVGNAVPPLLAKKIADIVFQVIAKGNG